MVIIMIENEDKKTDTRQEPSILDKSNYTFLISVATDVGISIAIPLTFFIFIGHLMDKQFGTSPLFIILGLLLSMISTGIILTRRIKKYISKTNLK
jgi:F0F1-type ATP synthase assembly protein I